MKNKLKKVFKKMLNGKGRCEAKQCAWTLKLKEKLFRDLFTCCDEITHKIS